MSGPSHDESAPPAAERAGGARARVVAGLALGVVVGVGLGLIEVGSVIVGRPLAFDSGGEKARFLFCMLGLFIAAGGAVGALGGVIASGVVRGAARLGSSGQWLPRLVTLLAAPAVVLAVLRLLSGRRVQLLPLRPLLLVAAAALALALVYGAAVAAFRLLRVEGRPAQVGFALLLATGAVAVHLLDEHALPRLYPAFHVGLEAIEATALVLAVVLIERRFRPASRLAPLLLALCALLSGRWALRQLVFWPALRAVAFEETTFAAHLLGAASALRIAPHGVAAGSRAASLPPAIAPSLPSGPRLRDADVFLITVDAMRADRLEARTAPRLAALAAEGARFDHAYSQIPHTSFSIATLLTGKYVHSLTELGERIEAHETLADLFRRERYKTAAFFPPSVFYIDHDRFAALEHDAFRFEYVKYEYLDARRRTDQVIDFLEAEHPGHAFLWVHYFDPHEPYDLHEEPGDPRPEKSGGAGRPRVLAAVDRYDGEVRYTDREVGRLVDWIRAHRPAAIILFTADHGEEFGEHGGRYHGTTLYEEQVRVPLFVVGPQIAPRRIAAPVGLVDVAPTLLSLVDMIVPARMRGHDLSPWLSRVGAPEARLGPTFAELGTRKLLARGDERFLCDLSRDFCELYDLASDPGEQHNLAGKRPEEASRLRAALDEWMVEHSRFERDPAQGEKERVQRALERCRLGDRSAVPEVAPLLDGPDRALAADVARSLLRLPDDASVHPSVLAAGRAHPDDMLLATLALRAGDRTQADGLAHRCAPASPPDAAPDDPLVQELCGEVAVALAAVGHPAAVSRLREALGRVDDEGLERRILMTLGAAGGRDGRVALAALVEHLDRSVRTRTETVHAIGELHRRAAVPVLVAAIGEERYVMARAEMARVLGLLGDRRAAPVLERLGRREPEPVVRDAIKVALRRLRGGTSDAHARRPRRSKLRPERAGW